MFFHFEYFGGECIFDFLVKLVNFSFSVFILELNIFLHLLKLVVVILKSGHTFHLICSDLCFHLFHKFMLESFKC